jgi:hypothetical protein
MPKFKVKASFITYLTAEIEADSLEEAHDIALNMDGGDFKQDGSDDWSVDSVEEVKR